MKKFLAIVLLLVVTAVAPGQLFAASAMTPSVVSLSNNGTILVLKVACVAHTDGTFTSEAISGADTGSVYDSSGAFHGNIYGFSADYWNMGFYLYEVWAVNPSSGHPTVAAAVTIADDTGAPLLASGELALSTSASGIVEASLGKFRAVNSKMTISVGDTGTAANATTIYIKLVR